MNVRQLRRALSESDLPFIVRGRHAVHAYHVIRKTADLDLVVRLRDAASGKRPLEGPATRSSTRRGRFVQLAPLDPASQPIDRILVDDRTFDRMDAESEPFRFGGTKCRSPSPRQRIAMTLRAVGSTGCRRFRQDAPDMVEPAEKNGLDLFAEDLHGLCDRCAGGAVRRKILPYAEEGR